MPKIWIFFLALGVPLPSIAVDRYLSNYIYEISSSTGAKNYIFGSSHISVGRFPVALGQCVKDIFLSVDDRYIEADQLAVKLMFSTRQRTLGMSVVGDFMEQERLKLLGEHIFGSGDEESVAKILSMDAMNVLRAVMSLIPGASVVFGVIDVGLDDELTLAARFLNKKIAYLETPEQQFRFFQVFSAENYASSINIALDLIADKAAAEFYQKNKFQLMKSSLVGDEAGMVLAAKSDPFYTYVKATIFDRNESLANTISEIVLNKNRRVFFALGAAHLGGEGGVLRRLSSAGFKVRRLCN